MHRDDSISRGGGDKGIRLGMALEGAVAGSPRVGVVGHLTLGPQEPEWPF